jgi:hypothetical protein
VAAALVLPILIALLVAKLVPAHHHRRNPPIVIRSEGSDQRLTRGVLASALETLFPKGNDTWRILNTPGNSSSRCAGLSAGSRRATGHSATAPYVFAGWLQVRLSDYVYANVAAAAASQDASPSASSRAAAACEAQVIAEGLQGLGYVVGKPHVFPSTSAQAGDGARSLRIVVPSHYKGRRRDWDYDTTSVRRGRLVLVVGTATAEPFQQMNQALARELVPKGV